MSLLFVCVCVLVTQSCTALYDPMDYSLLPGSSVHVILQARILKWVTISFFKGSTQPRDRTYVSRITGRFFYNLRHQGSPCYSLLLCFLLLFLFLSFSQVVVHFPSYVQHFATPWTAPHQASLSFIISQSLLKVMSIESVMPSNHLILCHPLLLPSVFPSIRFFSNESALHIRWPKYWSFSISPSNEYSGLISFRTDWFDLLPVSRALSSITV